MPMPAMRNRSTRLRARTSTIFDCRRSEKARAIAYDRDAKGKLGALASPTRQGYRIWHDGAAVSTSPRLRSASGEREYSPSMSDQSMRGFLAALEAGGDLHRV